MLKSAIVLALACAPITAFGQQPQSYEAARTVQAAATIQTISLRDRHLTLLRKDGTRLIVEAASSVQNFAAMKPGDKVLVIYHEGLVAEVKPKGQGKPNATTVRIDAVDPSAHTVTFTRPNGETRKLPVMRSDASQFIETLKPGDEVQVTWREAVALSIEPDKG